MSNSPCHALLCHSWDTGEMEGRMGTNDFLRQTTVWLAPGDESTS
jgi:hypothetical protein